MGARYFYGWNVVGGTFVMALLSFGLGFYGLTVYVPTLQCLHGWSASAVSAPVTVYYLAGALLTAAISDLYERLGPRAVVAGGSIAMAAGVAALGIVTQPWHLYPAFLVMSVGWGAMSGAAINIILAPWFERRRGLVVSLAFNGATLGGVLVAPALIPLIGLVGFARALATAALVLLVVLLPVATRVMRRGPEALEFGPDGDPGGPTPTLPSVAGRPRWRREALRTWRFWSVSAPFALGLAAQVGVLTHLVTLVTPALGAGGAARDPRRQVQRADARAEGNGGGAHVRGAHREPRRLAAVPAAPGGGRTRVQDDRHPLRGCGHRSPAPLRHP